ncbi:MAG: iron-sulfur cluster assembly scaffold protein [Pseudomonadota bacterium]
MINEVYNSKLLALAGNIKPNSTLDSPDATAAAVSKLCGSRITVQININDAGAVTDYAHDVKACALGQAAASAVAAEIIGASRDEVEQAQAQMRAMLKDGQGTPTGRFAELKYLQPVRDYPARHASTMLVLDALVDAYAQIKPPMAAQ